MKTNDIKTALINKIKHSEKVNDFLNTLTVEQLTYLESIFNK